MSHDATMTATATGRGGLRSGICWWVECAECVTGWAEDGVPHFDSPEQAGEHLFGEDGYGFTTRPDGRTLCRHCGEAADCAELGHDYTPWQPWHSDPEIEWRSCAHCGGGFEDRLTALGGTS